MAANAADPGVSNFVLRLVQRRISSCFHQLLESFKGEADKSWGDPVTAHGAAGAAGFNDSAVDADITAQQRVAGAALVADGFKNNVQFSYWNRRKRIVVFKNLETGEITNARLFQSSAQGRFHGARK